MVTEKELQILLSYSISFSFLYKNTIYINELSKTERQSLEIRKGRVSIASEG